MDKVLISHRQAKPDKGVKIFGVSLDTIESQKEFQQKDHLPFELLYGKFRPQPDG